MRKSILTLIGCLSLFSAPGQTNEIAQIRKVLNNWITDKKLPGLVIYIKQGDSTLLHEAFGYADREKRRPMTVDSRFRIFSMSKPITSLALMAELNKAGLTTKNVITDIFPAFKSRRSISLQQVMTHTGGLSYGGGFSWTGFRYWWYDPLEKSENLEEFIERLSGLPLKYRPGTEWHYSVSHDVQGAMIQKLSGLPLEQVMKRNFFDVLGMSNTGFVFKNKDMAHLGLVPFYGYDSDLQAAVLLEDQQEHDKMIASGGGGLYSTAGDFMRFLNYLRKPSGLLGIDKNSIERLFTNQLPKAVPAISEEVYLNSGYGYGVGVKLSNDEQLLPKGSYYWAGLGGTIFWVDPVKDIRVVAMMQVAGGRRSMEQKIMALCYEKLGLIK